MEPGAPFTRLYFLPNLRMGSLSWSVTLNKKERLVWDEPSSLFGPFISCKEENFM
jgi:hypothetical protein